MKERIEYIDIGKGCAILLMVMGHIIAWEYPKEFIQDSGLPAYNFSLYHFIYAFHMSLFFFFSGFVFKLRTVDFKGFESCVEKIGNAYVAILDLWVLVLSSLWMQFY